MSYKVSSVTPLSHFFKSSLFERVLTRGEKATLGRISYFLLQGGVTCMERLNSMSDNEILLIHGINNSSLIYIREALENFITQIGDIKWRMPTFNDTEIGYILSETANKKPLSYLDLIHLFYGFAIDENNHPNINVMEQIYFKLKSISRDEFISISKNNAVDLSQTVLA